MITVDTGSAHHNRIYIAWDNATGNSSSDKNGNNVVLAHSDDGGVTFSAPTSVSGNFIGRSGGIGADPYITSNGTVHVAWQDYAHSVIVDASSTDGGNTFSAPHAIAIVGGFQFNVAAQSSRGALVYPACGSYGTKLFCSYTNGSDAATNVYVATSTDGGASWTSKMMPAAGDQFNQWLAIDQSNGSVNVAYYDSGTHGATSTRYTLARSINGGKSYGASPVASALTNETCCAPSVDLGNQYRRLRRAGRAERSRAPGLDRPAPGRDRPGTPRGGFHGDAHALDLDPVCRHAFRQMVPAEPGLADDVPGVQRRNL